MSEIENIIEAIARRVVEEDRATSASAAIKTPWMTESQLAEYWELRNGEGQLTVHSIRKWTARVEYPLPCARMGELRRYDRSEVDKWANNDEAERYKQKAQLKRRSREVTKNLVQRKQRDNLQVL